MPWPEGVVTRQVTFSDSSGDGMKAGNVRVIVRANDSLMHLPTGVYVLAQPEVYTATFSIPVTDQDGIIWGDGKGNYYDTTDENQSHSYHVDIEYKVDDVWVQGRRFPNLVVPTSAGSFDLDTVLEVDATQYFIL